MPAAKKPHPHRHPFPRGWIPNRLDMGYDGTFKEIMVAPFAGQIVYSGLFNGWNGSHGVIIRAAEDVADVEWWCPTRCIYVVEGVVGVVRSGQHVHGGQTIAHAALSPYGDSYGHGALGAIEFGVAEDPGPGVTGYQTNAEAIRLGVGTTAARNMVLKFNEGCVKALGMKGATSKSNAGRP